MEETLCFHNEFLYAQFLWRDWESKGELGMRRGSGFRNTNKNTVLLKINSTWTSLGQSSDGGEQLMYLRRRREREGICGMSYG